MYYFCVEARFEVAFHEHGIQMYIVLVSVRTNCMHGACVGPNVCQVVFATSSRSLLPHADMYVMLLWK